MPENGVSTGRDRRTVVDDFRQTHGYREAKDIDDDLTEAPEYIVRLIVKVISVSLETEGLRRGRRGKG